MTLPTSGSGGTPGSILDAPARLALLFLLALLPFEPRRPVLRAAAFQFTLLEAVALLTLGLLFVSERSRLGSLVRRRPLPLLFLWAYVGAHALSAALAPAYTGLAFKFTLRMVAAGLLATAVAAVPRESRRRLFLAVAASAGLVALLAVLEAAGLRGLDPLLDRFREGAYHVGSIRRASGGSENPNLAAAVLVYGFLAATGLFATGSSWRRVVPAAALFSAGLLSTYSRGGLVAAVLGLTVLALTLRSRGGTRVAAPLTALAVLATTVAGFAAAGLPLGFRVSTGLAGPGHDARYRTDLGPLRLSVGEIRNLAVYAANTGRTAWTKEGDFGLVYQWFDVDRRVVLGRGSVPLTRTVAPGEEVGFDVPLEVPVEGRYLLVAGLNDGRSGSFASQGTAPAVIPAVVVANGGVGIEPPSRDALPRVADVSRPELWRTALAMWRDHPWTGVGSDNFRWLRSGYAVNKGHNGNPRDALWPANSTYLEAAATTGTLGLVALIGTLAATAWACWHRAKTATDPAETALFAVLLATTVAIAAHCSVDYFLGFTGHYLFFGFVVGMASSLGGPPSTPQPPSASVLDPPKQVRELGRVLQ